MSGKVDFSPIFKIFIKEKKKRNKKLIYIR